MFKKNCINMSHIWIDQCHFILCHTSTIQMV